MMDLAAVLQLLAAGAAVWLAVRRGPWMLRLGYALLALGCMLRVCNVVLFWQGDADMQLDTLAWMPTFVSAAILAALSLHVMQNLRDKP